MAELMPLPIVYQKCCRWWPIVPGMKVARCGLCGTKPDPETTRLDKPEHYPYGD